MNTKTKILSELILDTDRSFKWFHSNAFTSHNVDTDALLQSLPEGTPISITKSNGKNRFFIELKIASDGDVLIYDSSDEEIRYLGRQNFKFIISKIDKLTLWSPLSIQVREAKEGTAFTGTIGKSLYSGYIHEKGIVQLFLVEDVDGIKEDLLDQRLNVSYALLFLEVTSVSTTPVIKLIPDHHLPQGLIPENYTPGEGYSL